MSKHALVLSFLTSVLGACDQSENIGNNLDADAQADMARSDDSPQDLSGKRVFVTASPYGAVIGIPNIINSDGTVTPGVGPVQHANDLCNAAASAGSLKGRFVAWLSAYGESAIDHIADVGPWYEIDASHTMVFSNKANLMTTPHAVLDVDEYGQQQHGVFVWTGTTTGGQEGDNNCNDWSSNYSFDNGVVGSAEDSAGWTQSGALPSMSCNSTAHLYCFEQ